MENDKEYIILVHGTFAFQDSDHGDDWWQFGSPFSQKLLSILGPKYKMGLLSSKCFTWSGENKVIERTVAGKYLISDLADFEQNNIKYHLIGHSHGGSVIWSCLCQSIFAGLKYKPNPNKTGKIEALKFDSLKSWITIGTPFIIPKNRRNLDNTLIKKFRYNWYLMRVFGGFSTLFLILILIGQLSISTGLLFLILSATLSLYFTMHAENRKIEWHELVGNEVAENYYKDLWLGLSSIKDEAINGLKIANEFELPESKEKPISREKIKHIYPGNRYFGLINTLLAFLWSKIFNHILMPLAKKGFVFFTRNTALGIDRPNMDKEHLKVSFSPFLSSKKVIEKLPQEIEDQLYNEVQESIKNNVSSIHNEIYNLNMINKIMKNEYEFCLSGEELIHTNYFSNDYIINRIAQHIRENSIV